MVVYCLELRDYYPTVDSKKSQPTIQDEINSLVQKCNNIRAGGTVLVERKLNLIHFILLTDEILKKLGNKLMKEDYQRVLLTLKLANSAVGDELENLLAQLQVHSTAFPIISYDFPFSYKGCTLLIHYFLKIMIDTRRTASKRN